MGLGLEMEHQGGGKLGGSEPGGRRTRLAGGHVALSGLRGAEVDVPGWTGRCVCVRVCA